MGNLEMDIKFKWPYKFTLSEIQCAAGYLMMKRIDKLNNLRIKRAKKFIKKFHGENLNFNIDFKNRRHVFHLLSAYVKLTKLNNHKIIYSYLIITVSSVQFSIILCTSTHFLKK